MKNIKVKGEEVILFEPTLKEATFFKSRLVHKLDQLKTESNVIVANLVSNELPEVLDKAYGRDLYGSD